MGASILLSEKTLSGLMSAVTERVIRFKNGVQPLSEGRTTRKRNKA